MPIYILFLFLFGLSIDYKGVEEGGNVFQLVIIFTTMVSGLIIVLKPVSQNKLNPIFRKIGWILFLHLVSTFVVAFVCDIEFARYSRVIITYVLLVLGYLVGGRITQFSKFDLDKITLLMATSSFVSIIFTLIYGVLSSGVELSEMRYQILSPLMYVAMPIFAYYAFISKSYRIYSLLALLIILVIILVSATRSWLIGYIGVMFTAFFYGNLRRHGSAKSIALGVFNGASFLMFVIILLSLFSPDLASRMIDRVFVIDNVGFDITTATRLAEIDYQIDLWTADASRFLFGNGLGASYGFGGENVEQLVILLGNDGNASDLWFAGHNFWIYSVFTQGIVAGVIVPLIMLHALFVCTKNVFTKNFNKFCINGDQFGMHSLFSLIFISVILQTIGGNPLGSRMLSMFIGVILGLTYSLINNNLAIRKSHD